MSVEKVKSLILLSGVLLMKLWVPDWQLSPKALLAISVKAFLLISTADT